MERRTKALIVIIFFLFNTFSQGIASAATISSRDTWDEINVPDEALKQAINKSLGLPKDSSITEHKAGRLTDFEWGGPYNIDSADSIEDLTGMEYAVNLTRLTLPGHSITDLSPLAAAGLTENFETLSLDNNLIEDISPVATMTSVKEINLYKNRISNIEALSELANLSTLRISDNTISDVSPLSGLTGLEAVDLANNEISDVSSLSTLTNLNEL